MGATSVPPKGPLPLPGERTDEFSAHGPLLINHPLTIKEANIAGGRGNGPPRLSTQAPPMVPASGLMTFVLSSRPRRRGNGGSA